MGVDRSYFFLKRLFTSTTSHPALSSPSVTQLAFHQDINLRLSHTPERPQIPPEQFPPLLGHTTRSSSKGHSARSTLPSGRAHSPSGNQKSLGLRRMGHLRAHPSPKAQDLPGKPGFGRPGVGECHARGLSGWRVKLGAVFPEDLVSPRRAQRNKEAGHLEKDVQVEGVGAEARQGGRYC